MKYNEGCTFAGLILTQKIGERLDIWPRTFCVLIYFCKAFDTVNERLLWERLRSLGVCGKPLPGHRAGFLKRTLIVKMGAERSAEKPDVGIGTRQGQVDSTDTFAAFIDDLDSETERKEEEIGRKRAMGRSGRGNRRDDETRRRYRNDCLVRRRLPDSL